MRVEELAEYYQETGFWTDEMETKQNKYLVGNIQEIYSTFQLNIEDYQMNFESYVGLRKGLWQAENGFARTSEQVKERLERFREERDESDSGS